MDVKGDQRYDELLSKMQTSKDVGLGKTKKKV
jgi:hypothetical protein